MTLETIEKLIAIIVGGSGGIATIWFKIIRPFLNKRKMLKKETAATLAAITAIIPKVETIYAEMTPNGGGSIKDVVRDMQGALARNEKMGRLSLEELAVSYYECDPQGKIVYASRPLFNLLGRQPEDVLGLNWMAMIHPQDREQVMEEWDNSVEDQRNFEHKCRLRNGSTKTFDWVIIRKNPILTGKKLIGFYGTIKATVE